MPDMPVQSDLFLNLEVSNVMPLDRKMALWANTTHFTAMTDKFDSHDDFNFFANSTKFDRHYTSVMG